MVKNWFWIFATLVALVLASKEFFEGNGKVNAPFIKQTRTLGHWRRMTPSIDNCDLWQGSLTIRIITTYHHNNGVRASGGNQPWSLRTVGHTQPNPFMLFVIYCRCLLIDDWFPLNHKHIFVLYPYLRWTSGSWNKLVDVLMIVDNNLFLSEDSVDFWTLPF